MARDMEELMELCVAASTKIIFVLNEIRFHKSDHLNDIKGISRYSCKLAFACLIQTRFRQVFSA